jgi:hypothetical protein
MKQQMENDKMQYASITNNLSKEKQDMQLFLNGMKIIENQLRKENEDMNYKMNEMIKLYNNQLNKINGDMMWLKQEIKNKEMEME